MAERTPCLGCDRASAGNLCKACWRLIDLDNRRELNLAYDEAETTSDPSLRETAMIRFRLALSSAAAAARRTRWLGYRRGQEIKSWAEWRPMVLRIVGDGGLDFGYG